MSTHSRASTCLMVVVIFLCIVPPCDRMCCVSDSIVVVEILTKLNELHIISHWRLAMSPFAALGPLKSHMGQGIIPDLKDKKVKGTGLNRVTYSYLYRRYAS